MPRPAAHTLGPIIPFHPCLLFSGEWKAMPTMRHWDRGAHHSQKCFLGAHKPTDLSHFGSPESTAQSLCVLLWLCKQILDLESGNLDSIQPLTSHVILCNTLPIAFIYICTYINWLVLPLILLNRTGNNGHSYYSNKNILKHRC